MILLGSNKIYFMFGVGVRICFSDVTDMCSIMGRGGALKEKLVGVRQGINGSDG